MNRSQTKTNFRFEEKNEYLKLNFFDFDYLKKW
jgi:hypothetical protein